MKSLWNEIKYWQSEKPKQNKNINPNCKFESYDI